MDSSLVLSYNSPHSLLKSQGRKVTAPYESLSSEHCAECDLRALPPCSCCHSAARRLYSNISLLGRESESQGAACCGFTSRGRSSLMLFPPADCWKPPFHEAELGSSISQFSKFNTCYLSFINEKITLNIYVAMKNQRQNL